MHPGSGNPRTQNGRQPLRRLFAHGTIALEYAIWGPAHTAIRYVAFSVAVLVHLVLAAIWDWKAAMIVVGAGLVYIAVAIPPTSHRRRRTATLAVASDQCFIILASLLTGSPETGAPWMLLSFMIPLVFLTSRLALRLVVSGVLGLVVGFALDGRIAVGPSLAPAHLAAYLILVTVLAGGLFVMVALANGAAMNRRAQVLADATASLEREVQHHRTLFDALPGAVIEVNAAEAVDRFAYLRAQGVSDLATDLFANPDRRDALVGLMEVSAANAEAVELLGIDRDSVPLGRVAPYLFPSSAVELFARVLVCAWDRIDRVEFPLIQGEEGEERHYSVTFANPSKARFRFDRLIITAADVTHAVSLERMADVPAVRAIGA